MKKQETNLQKFINFMVHAFVHVGIMTSIILTLFGICYNIIQGENMYIVKIATTIVSAVFLSYIVSAVTTSKQLKNMDLKIEEKLKAVIKDTLSKEHENLSGQHGALSKEHGGLSKEHEDLSKDHEDLSKDHEKLLDNHKEITEAHINHENDIKSVDDFLKSMKDDFIKPIFEETNRSKNVSEVSQDMYDHLNFLKKDIQEVSAENLKLKEGQKNLSAENLNFKKIQKNQSEEIQKLKVQNKNLQKKYDDVIKISNIKKGNSKLGQVVDKVEDTPKPKKPKTIIR